MKAEEHVRVWCGCFGNLAVLLKWKGEEASHLDGSFFD